MDSRSLDRLEFGRVTAAIAARAESPRAASALAGWRPIPVREERRRENALLGEAIRRNGEPGPWCFAGRGELASRLDPGAGERLDGPGLLEVLSWLEAAHAVREAWQEEEHAARFPGLAERARSLPRLEALRARLAKSLEPDGRLSDAASPALAHARRALAEGERRIERKLERWARGFGEGSYVTRHAERFVALVPAAGFPRRRGIVHDVSGSGQSLFVEPIEACEENNQLIELRAEAAAEERRVLLELAEAVRSEAEPLAATEEVLVHLDTLRARARWAAETGAVALDPGAPRLRLAGARHPLLAHGERKSAVVPLDLALGPDERLLVVSGPNMGGKTVLLKTVGLCVVLGHAALPVPAKEGSELPEISCVVADLGDEQSVDQGLSTFAAHLRSLSEMAEQASPGSLLLCDELGAGTDPEEGAALGRALIEHFAARRAWGVVTTHLGTLKRAPAEVPGVCGGSLEFDRETLTPRYRFLPGVPGASHALEVAERLEFPPALLERARSLTPESTRAVEHLIGSLQDARRRMDEETGRLEAARAAAEASTETHRAAAAAAREELSSLRRRLTSESDVLLAHARELWQTVQREARREEKRRAEAGTLRASIAAVEAESEALARAAAAAAGESAEARAGGAVEAGTLAIGQRVRVVDLGVEAEVASLPDAEGKLTLRRGSWNIQSHVSRLAPVSGAPPAQTRRNGAGATWTTPEEAPSLDVDLRGKEVDEALQQLDHALDRALVHGLNELRVVHGVGRGVLRAAVERHLTGHPQVASQRLGAVGEGGRGVTIVRLR